MIRRSLILLASCCLLLTPAVHADDLASYEASPDVIQTPGYVLFFNAQGPLSYATATRLPANAVSLGTVYGESCQHGVSLPFTANLRAASGRVDTVFGNSGFIHALEQIHQKNSEVAGVYNVQVDLHQTQILTVYTRLCTEVTGVGYKLGSPAVL